MKTKLRVEGVWRGLPQERRIHDLKRGLADHLGQDANAGTIYFHLWFSDNLIYCQDAHSFTHRLFDWARTHPDASKFDAQHAAWSILADMRADFLAWLKEED